MIETLTFLAGAGVLAAGITAGRAMRVRPPKPAALMCTCKHGYGQHEQGARCAALVQRTNYGGGYAVLGTEWVPCPCLSYDGPEPLPKVWTPGGGL